MDPKLITEPLIERFKEAKKNIAAFGHIDRVTKHYAVIALGQIAIHLGVEQFTVSIALNGEDIVLKFLENRGTFSIAPDYIDIIIRQNTFRYVSKFGLGQHGTLDHFTEIGMETLKNVTKPLFEKMYSRRITELPF